MARAQSPRRARVVAAAGLIHRVGEHRPEHGHPVTDPAGRAGQVDDEHPAGQPGQAAGQDRGRDARGRTRGPDCLGDAGDLAVEYRRVISGVRSPGVSPVPPVVTTTS